MQPNQQDLKYARSVRNRMNETITQLRSEIEHVDERQLKAMFETSAEVLGAVVRAFEHYERISESEWKTLH